MAYRSRYRSRRPRRRFYRRRRVFRGKRLRRTIKSTVNRMAETKFLIFPMVSVFPTIPNSWQYFIPSIAQGTSIFGQRLGRKLAIRGYSLVGTLIGGQSNLATDDKVNTVRFVTGLCSSSFATPASTPLSLINFDDPILRVGSMAQAGLKLFKDRYMELKTAGRDSTGYLPAMKRFFFKHKFKKDYVIEYADDTATTPNRNIFIAFRSDSALAPSPGFTNGFLKVWYKDI